jgi:hypothetical protein
MTRLTTVVVVAACTMNLLGTASADAKGGSPGYHSFAHQHAAVFYPCGARYPFGAARGCLARVHFQIRAEASR